MMRLDVHPEIVAEEDKHVFLMIDLLSRLRSVRKIYSHASCPDGTASGMICARSFPACQPVDIQFIQYDTDEHRKLIPEPGCLFIDITPHLSVWQNWKEFSPIILDHHATAKPATEGLGGIYGGPTESGASLAFKYVMSNLYSAGIDFEKWREFSRLCAIRDTWQEQDPDWPIACSYAHAMNLFGSLDLIKSARDGTTDFDNLNLFGSLLYISNNRKASVLAKSAFIVDLIPGVKAGIFNCTDKLTSEACHIVLNNGCDLAVSFFMTWEDEAWCAVVSLRSKKGGISVNKLAEQFGGGGHQSAAGFRLKNADNVCLASLSLVLKHAVARLT